MISFRSQVGILYPLAEPLLETKSPSPIPSHHMTVVTTVSDPENHRFVTSLDPEQQLHSAREPITTDINTERREKNSSCLTSIGRKTLPSPAFRVKCPTETQIL